MGATHRIDQLNIEITLPARINGKDFPMTCEAQVFFGETPDDGGADFSDSAHVAKIGFGAAVLKFHDLPADMRAAIEAACISAAYDSINAETLELI